MPVERRGPAVRKSFGNKGGRGEMIKAPMDHLHDLRRKIYAKAKAEPAWRFWGLYVHVCKEETLRKAYEMAKENNGAPGKDGVTFESIESSVGGVDGFLEQIRDELVGRRYLPLRNRRVEIPKEGSQKARVLGIPSIRDRVVQGALMLILEPIFEADFQPGSFGFRRRRSPHQAIHRVVVGVSEAKTRVIDLDLKAYFDNVRHHLLMEKVAKRVQDNDVMHLLKLILKAGGKKGVPQGGVISPLLSNIYLNEVDRMLERAKEVTQRGRFVPLEYARYADDLVVLVDFHPRYEWLLDKVNKRLREELQKIQVEVNEEKSCVVDLLRGDSFGYLGFDIRLVRTRRGRLRPYLTPKAKNRKKLLKKLKTVIRSYRSQPLQDVIEAINPILRGWVNYFRSGDSTRCFSYVRWWVERKIRRHLARACQRPGFGWKRWSTPWLYKKKGLFHEYRLLHYPARLKTLPVRYAT
jgi:RNA-directed DNA polymerase